MNLANKAQIAGAGSASCNCKGVGVGNMEALNAMHDGDESEVDHCNSGPSFSLVFTSHFNFFPCPKVETFFFETSYLDMHVTQRINMPICVSPCEAFHAQS
jgi:hypothetical protein